MNREQSERASRFLRDSSKAPLREQMEDVLAELIRKGGYGEGKRFPTARELAATYKVSLGTVANAIGALKRQGILQARPKKGTFLSEDGGNSGQVRTGNIGVVLQAESDVALQDPIHLEVFNGVQERCSEKRYKVVYLGTRGAGQNDSLPFQIRDIDGLVYLVTTKASLDFLKSVVKRGLPVVATDWYHPRMPIDGVVIDNVAGGLAVMRHLLQLGHKRIAFLNSSGMSADGRFLAYRQALAEAEIEFDAGLVREKLLVNARYGHDAMAELWKKSPTAVFSFNDYLTIGAILAALRRGIRVPEDFSAAGFGNQGVLLAGALGLDLTTTCVDLRKMGRLAVDLLLKRINGQISGPGQVAQVSPVLHVGTSSGPGPRA